MKKIQHKNIVRLIEVIQKELYIFLVMEYCQSDLHDLLYNILKKKPIPEKYGIYFLN